MLFSCAILLILISCSFPVLSGDNAIDGEPSPLEAINVPVRGAMPSITTLGDGSATKILQMPGGVANASAYLTIPNGVRIMDAKMRLSGQGQSGSGGPEMEFNYTHVNITRAWKGNFSTLTPPSLSSMMGNPFNSTQKTNISRHDGKVAKDTSPNMQIEYHLFEIIIDPGTIYTLSYTYIGLCHFSSGTTTTFDVRVWNYNSNAWSLLKTTTVSGNTIPDQVVTGSFPTPYSNHLNSTNRIYISVYETGASASTASTYARTDYISVNVSYSHDTPLTDPSLDIGQDSSVEWQSIGPFTGPIELNETTCQLRTKLQAAISTGTGSTDLYLAFDTVTKGTLTIDNILITLEDNDPPQVSPLGLIELDEDVPFYVWGDDLVSYITDDGGFANLTITIFGSDPAKVSAALTPDGHHLNFTPAKDFFGVVQMNLSIKDKGLDRVTGGGDDLLVHTQNFTVKVIPTDDPPVILTVGGVTPVVGNVSFAGLSGASQGKWFNVTVNATDFDGDAIGFSINTTIPNLAMDPVSGNISFLPDQSQIGNIKFTINATEENKTIPEAERLFDAVRVDIMVQNVNDDPRIESLKIGTQTKANKRGESVQISALEDAVTIWTLQYTDIDGDGCTFSSNFSNPRFIIDTANGNCSIAPLQVDVGTHYLNITAADGNGGTDFIWVKVNVLNVNDRPVNNNFTATVSGNNASIIANEGTDEDGDVLIYKWTFGDGTEAQGIQQNHSYSRLNVSKDYLITLIVSDGKLDSGIASRYVTIFAIMDVTDDDTNVSDDDTDDDDVDDDTDDDTNVTDDDKPQENGFFANYWWLLVIIVLAVLILVIVVLVLMRRKKDAKPQETLPEPNPPVPSQPQQAPISDPQLLPQPGQAYTPPQPAPQYYPPQQSMAPDLTSTQPGPLESTGAQPGTNDAADLQDPNAQGPDMMNPEPTQASAAQGPEGTQAPPEMPMDPNVPR